MKKNTKIYCCKNVSSPIGDMAIYATNKGLCYLVFIGQKREEQHLLDIIKNISGTIEEGANEHIEQTKNELEEYFNGTRKEFSISLDLIGTDFRIQSWNTLRDIPYGKTITYKQQSITMNNPLAIRAIASSNGANKISIIVPCHRVIGSNGSLTGYAGGLHRKKWLLDFEKKNSNQGYQSTLDL